MQRGRYGFWEKGDVGARVNEGVDHELLSGGRFDQHWNDGAV
jgi:hypothetical protein